MRESDDVQQQDHLNETSSDQYQEAMQSQPILDPREISFHPTQNLTTFQLPQREEPVYTRENTTKIPLYERNGTNRSYEEPYAKERNLRDEGYRQFDINRIPSMENLNGNRGSLQPTAQRDPLFE